MKYKIGDKVKCINGSGAVIDIQSTSCFPYRVDVPSGFFNCWFSEIHLDKHGSKMSTTAVDRAWRAFDPKPKCDCGSKHSSNPSYHQSYCSTINPKKNEMYKYELTNESIEHEGITLYRIKALKDFDDVKKGDLGGYVESEINLGHSGSSWLYGDTKAWGPARVYGGMQIHSVSNVTRSERSSIISHNTIGSLVSINHLL